MVARAATHAVLLLAFVLPASVQASGETASVGIHTNVVAGSLTSAYPSAGALLVGDDPETAVSWCSGVLIGCQTFLTAAHCVCETDGKNCHGSRAPRAGSRIVYFQHAGFFRVADIVVHPDYRFPAADLAVIRLETPVTGIAPAHLATTAPPIGTVATIVGFGRSSGQSSDFGLKRAGEVTTDACRNGISDAGAVCWTFTGTSANSCDGDSGGPLFTNQGSGPTVIGLTSGGQSNNCVPGDVSFDTSIAAHRAWIDDAAGADVGTLQCGGVPRAGDADASIEATAGGLSADHPSGRHSVTVPPGTNELRVALNAEDNGLSNFDLYLKADSEPTSTRFDCHATGPGQYGYCEIHFPTPGTWHVLAERVSGAGAYQLTTTLLGGAAPECGNNRRETGEDCDGSDDTACPGVCSACACAYQCREGGLLPLRTRLGWRVSFTGLLINRAGAYDGLDPRSVGLTVTFDDGETSPLEIVIPAGRAGWGRSVPERGLYVWTGTVTGPYDVLVRCRRLSTGNWQLRVTAARHGPHGRVRRRIF